MSELVVQGELTRPSGFRARFDLAVPMTGVTAVTGPSGAGKSTMLRVVAGFEPAAPVTVRYGAEAWQTRAHAVPAHLRPVSTVFQDARLFPHLDVAGNLRYPLRRARAGPAAPMGFDEVVEELALGPLLEAFPATLSGGQRQRVALGRALLAPARLWLLDEPLSALDASARGEIAPFLKRICLAHRLPILYVTHSLADVVQIADRVVAMRHGEITANESIEAPERTRVPWREMGEELAILTVKWIRHDTDYDLSELELGGETLWVRGHGVPEARTGGRARLLVSARDVSLARAAVPAITVLNQLPVVVAAIEERDAAACLVRLDCHGQTLFSRITRRSCDQLGLAPGQRVHALIKTMALTALDA